MRLVDALPRLESLYKVRFSELFEKCDMETDKGRVGKLLQGLLGMLHTGRLLDFDDGELKTNMSNPSGKPLETMYISQISKKIDFLLNRGAFRESWIYSKIRDLVYLPVVKEGNPPEWYFLFPIHVQIREGDQLFQQLSIDFDNITRKMVLDVEEGDGYLHTSSGEFIQIRTKDSKPYFPIHSEKYGRYVSNKNFAFYFKKEFMTQLLRTSEHYPDIT